MDQFRGPWSILLLCFLLNFPQIYCDYYSDYSPDGLVDMRSNRVEDHPPDQPVATVTGIETPPPPGPSGPPTLEQIHKEYALKWNSIREKATREKVPNAQFTAKVQSCAAKLANCTKEDYEEGALCYLRCLLEGKPFLKVMSTAIRDTLNDLCAPIHTIFYEVFKSAQIGAGHLKTYAKFNEALGVNPNFGHDTSKLSLTVLVAIIKYSVTTLTPLRRVLMQLETSLNAQHEDNDYLAIVNPTCRVLQMYDAVEAIAETLYNDQATSDVFTPGFALFSSVSKYLSSRVTHHMTVLREGMRMFTGKAMGLSCSGDTPSGNCDNFGRYSIPGFPIPPPIGGNDYVSIANPACPPTASPAPAGPSGPPRPLPESDGWLPIQPIGKPSKPTAKPTKPPIGKHEVDPEE